ncbi:MAG: hypothetical protein M1481_01655 [Candidatus Thermoplasmatota archaeon]|nr:hypothetical protein [Candidatus Thermoplasmatota archaeon]MCL5963136.1 hypothetical protein [Candidatus Thermoplasmatota archaeon]
MPTNTGSGGAKLEKDMKEMLEYLMNGLSDAIVEKQKEKINISDVKTKEEAVRLINEIYNVILNIAGKEHADRIKERLMTEVEKLE